MLTIDQIQMKVGDLQKALNERQPGYVGLLKVIHENLAQQPELSYMLKDEEIAVIISGLERFNQVEITEPKMKKGISKKQGRLISEDDV